MMRKDAFEKHCQENGLNGHPIENMVEMLLVPVKRLRSYQIRQRIEKKLSSNKIPLLFL